MAVNFILSYGYNNKNKLKVTLKFTLTKVTFKGDFKVHFN